MSNSGWQILVVLCPMHNYHPYMAKYARMVNRSITTGLWLIIKYAADLQCDLHADVMSYKKW